MYFGMSTVKRFEPIMLPWIFLSLRELLPSGAYPRRDATADECATIQRQVIAHFHDRVGILSGLLPNSRRYSADVHSARKLSTFLRPGGASMVRMLHKWPSDSGFPGEARSHLMLTQRGMQWPVSQEPRRAPRRQSRSTASGKKAVTVQLGASTIWLMRSSAVTLHRM